MAADFTHRANYVVLCEYGKCMILGYVKKMSGLTDVFHFFHSVKLENHGKILKELPLRECSNFYTNLFVPYQPNRTKIMDTLYGPLSNLTTPAFNNAVGNKIVREKIELLI